MTGHLLAPAERWRGAYRATCSCGLLEGGHTVCPGDWIITGVQGENYPCKPDIFDATYDPILDDDEPELGLSPGSYGSIAWDALDGDSDASTEPGFPSSCKPWMVTTRVSSGRAGEVAPNSTAVTHERVQGIAQSRGYEVCAPDAPCYCCLAAEVQALREQVQRVRNAIAGGLGVSYYCPTDDPVWISIDVLLNIFDGGGDI